MALYYHGKCGYKEHDEKFNKYLEKIKNDEKLKQKVKKCMKWVIRVNDLSYGHFPITEDADTYQMVEMVCCEYAEGTINYTNFIKKVLNYDVFHPKFAAPSMNN